MDFWMSTEVTFNSCTQAIILRHFEEDNHFQKRFFFQEINVLSIDRCLILVCANC